MIEPMLARSPKPGELDNILDSPNWYAEEKFDGARYLAQVDNSGDVHFLSRRISVKDGEQVDKRDKVPHLNHLDIRYAGLILDGELMPPADAPQTSSQVFHGPNVGFQVYQVFDILQVPGLGKPIDLMGLSYLTRVQKMEKWVRQLGKDFPDWGAFVVIVERAGRYKRELGERILARGGEGLVLKPAMSKYIPGGRKDWVKWKAVTTYDCVITGFDPPSEWYAEPGKKGHDGILYPNGRRTKFWEKGWIGAIRFGQYQDGELIEIGTTSGMTDEMRGRFTKDQSLWIGEVIEVKAQERSKKEGSLALRHPRLIRVREDRNAKDCTVEA